MSERIHQLTYYKLDDGICGLSAECQKRRSSGKPLYCEAVENAEKSGRGNPSIDTAFTVLYGEGDIPPMLGDEEGFEACVQPKQAEQAISQARQRIDT